MAEKPAQERTEKPTLDRLNKARKEGTIPQSKELPSALILVMLLVVLGLTAGNLYRFFVSQAHDGLSLQVGSAADISGYSHLLRSKLTQSMQAILPLMVVAAAMSVFACLLVSGWTYSPKAVQFKAKRLNPINGFKNLLSTKNLFSLLVAIVKLVVLLAIVWYYLGGKLQRCLALRWETAEGALAGIAQLVFGLLVRITIGVVAIAAIDWLYQKWNYKRELRMTKEEVKQERKDKEISPQLRGRIRGVQIELVRKRMLQEVPQADVVLTNPTHVAVALRYELESMDAPTVVAKGPEMLCEKIKEIARAHGVPILYRPELARTIYNTVEVGQVVPEALYVAVAEVMAMIYRARKKGNFAPSSTS